MPNTFDEDFTLPDVATMRPGYPILAEQIADVLNCLNVGNAWVGSGHAFQQTWQGVDVDVAEGVERLAVARWWVHAPSDQHVTVRIRVRVEGRGRVTFSSDLGADSIDLEFGDPDAEDGSVWYDVGDLVIGEDVGDAGFAYEAGDLITMDVEGGLGMGDGAGAVVQVAAEILPLESPLAAVLVDGYRYDAYPFDPSTAVAGAPLTAARGHQIESTLSSIIRRPLVRFAWSGLSSDFAESLRAFSPLAHIAVSPTPPPFPGTLGIIGRDRRLYSHARVSDIDSDFGSVFLDIGGSEANHATNTASDAVLYPAFDPARGPTTIATGHADPLVIMTPVVKVVFENLFVNAIGAVTALMIRTGDSV